MFTYTYRGETLSMGECKEIYTEIIKEWRLSDGVEYDLGSMSIEWVPTENKVFVHGPSILDDEVDLATFDAAFVTKAEALIDARLDG